MELDIHMQVKLKMVHQAFFDKPKYHYKQNCDIYFFAWLHKPEKVQNSAAYEELQNSIISVFLNSAMWPKLMTYVCLKIRQWTTLHNLQFLLDIPGITGPSGWPITSINLPLKIVCLSINLSTNDRIRYNPRGFTNTHLPGRWEIPVSC